MSSVTKAGKQNIHLIVDPDLATQQTTKSNAECHLAILAIEIRTHHIETEGLQNIFETSRNLVIIIVAIYIKGIAHHNKVPVELFKQRDFIGKKTIEMMLHMCSCIKRSRGAVGIIRRSLETVQVLAGEYGLVAVKMAVILHIHCIIIEEATNVNTVFKLSC